MALTAHWFTLSQSAQWNGSPVNWLTDSIKVALITSAYTPNQDTDQFFSTPAANETTGTGYTAGGVTLAGKSVGSVTPTHEIPLIASASTWTAASFTARYAVIYKSTGTNTTSPLLGWVDFGGDETVSTGNLTINWDASNGVLALTAL